MYAILVDVTRCTGCERCVAACVEANGNGPDGRRGRPGHDPGRPLGEPPVHAWSRWTRAASPARAACTAWSRAASRPAWSAGSRKTPEGPVVYDPDKCIGCRYCMLACPFHVPRYEWDETAPFMRKCDMCFERLDEGGRRPASRPVRTRRMVFGERDALLDRAHEPIRPPAGPLPAHGLGRDTSSAAPRCSTSPTSTSSPVGWPEPSAAVHPLADRSADPQDAAHRAERRPRLAGR